MLQSPGSFNHSRGAGKREHRPPNAYILYTQTIRKAVRDENPTLTNLEFSILLGQIWKNAPEDIRRKFQQEAREMQSDFKTRNPEYCYRRTGSRIRNRSQGKRKLEQISAVESYPIIDTAHPAYEQLMQMEMPFQGQESTAQIPVPEAAPEEKPVPAPAWAPGSTVDGRRPKTARVPGPTPSFTSSPPTFDIWSEEPISE